jgi:hypothetical protein
LITTKTASLAWHEIGDCQHRGYAVRVLIIDLIVLISLAIPETVRADVVTGRSNDKTRVDRPAAETLVRTRPKGSSAALIREAYADRIESMALANRDALAEAIAAGRIVQFSHEGANVTLRLDGDHPIGEKDLAAQHLYIAALPETLGCLLHVASRVTSGPLEVTSLVRHLEYQDELARGNSNANATVPTHTMGLAFDISRKTSPEVANELRAVLEQMAADGDLFYIAERKQAVFHVVPTPERRAFYAAVFETLRHMPAAPVEEQVSIETIPLPQPEEPAHWLAPFLALWD